MRTNSLKQSFLGFSTVMTLIACNPPESDKATVTPGGPQGQTCSLAGSWTRCTDNGGNTSMKVHLQVSGNNLQETIEGFNNNNTCSGAADSTFPINAVVTLGALGQSTFIAGGTNADLVPDVDFGGCGAGQPLYTVLKFNDACDQFQIPTTEPDCDANNRGNTLDPQAFIKQP